MPVLPAMQSQQSAHTLQSGGSFDDPWDDDDWDDDNSSTTTDTPVIRNSYIIITFKFESASKISWITQFLVQTIFNFFLQYDIF